MLLSHSSSRPWRASLLILWACLLPQALSLSVNDAEGFRTALLDSSTSSISLQGPIVLDSASFGPIPLDRALSVTAATPAAYLDFGSSQVPLISIQPGGNLTLVGLQLVNIYPLLPLPLSEASSLMPIAAINITSSSAQLVITLCVLLVNGPPSNLTDTLPFWAAQQQADGLQPIRTPALLASASTQPNHAGQFVSFCASRTASRRGSSVVQITDTEVVFDPSGCITPGLQLLAWDSLSLSQALQSVQSSISRGSGSDTPKVLLLADTILTPPGWSWMLSANSSSSTVHISSCSSTSSPTILDLNFLPGAFLLQPGATLTFSSGLALLHAAPVSQVYHSNQSPPLNWPYSNRSSSALTLLTLGSIDVSQGGRLVLQDVAVEVQDAAAAQAAFQQVIGAGGSKPSLQLSAAGAGFAVSDWNTSLAGWSLGGTSAQLPAADGARLVMQDVSVQQQEPSLCVQQGGNIPGVMAVSTEAQLLAALTEADISTMLVTANITLQRSSWQGLQNLKISRPVLSVHGCKGSDGQMVAIDFSELQVMQAQPMFLVSSQLQFSGDLALLGIPDHPDAAGSWVLLPLFQLTGPGSMVFQGVQLQGYSQPMLQAMGSPSAAGRSTVVQLNSNAALAHLLTLPRSEAAQLVPALYSNSSSSSSINKLSSHKLRSMLAAPDSSSSGGNAGADSGAGYYAWVGTQLSWGARKAAAGSHDSLGPGSIAAIVLGCVLGLVLIAAATALLLHKRRQRRRPQQWSEVQPSSKDTSCWDICGRRSQGQQQLLQPGMGSSYADFTANSWGQQVPPCASVLASFGSGGRDTSVRAGLAYYSHTSQGAAGALNGPGTMTAGMLVHTSPNSGTTGASFRVPVGPGGEATRFQDLMMQQQQQGLDVEYAGPSFARGTDTCLAAAAAGVTASGAAAAAAGVGADQGDATDASGGDDAGGQKGGGGIGQYKQQVFEAARKQLGATAGDLARSDALVLEVVLGEGSFGKVFRGYWKGTLVAVKTMMFPAAMAGKEKREKMAMMETAISSMLSHPNIVQMYTYYLRPVLVGHEATLTGGAAAEEAARLDSSSVGDSTMNAAFLNEGLSDSVHSWEVQLVLEYCDKGSLRALLNKQGTFALPDGRRDMVTILDCALDVARAMVHLHSQNIIHSDLKARNILLKSSGGAEGRPFVAKVADFGLSMRIDPNATHVSNVYQGTMTHMAPETMLRGKLSRSSDVYAFGVLLWELCTGGHAFKGIPRALLGHEVTHQQRRPQFPDDCPFDFQLLACRCWESDASIRPSFAEILAELLRMRERITAAAAADQAAADAQPAADASAAAGACSTAAMAGRSQSEPLQTAPRASMPAAAAASDPVQSLRVAGAASAMAAAAAAVAAAAGGVAAVAAAAAGAEADLAHDVQAAAAGGEIAVQQQQPAAGVFDEGPRGLSPSGPLPSHSIPLLLPASNQPPGQPGMQVQLGGNGELGALAQQQQQQQQGPPVGLSSGRESPQLADATAQLQEGQQQSPYHEALQQQQQLQAQPSTAQHSDSIMNHALLDGVMLQVSITAGSSLMSGNVVVPPQHRQQQLPSTGAAQHSWPHFGQHHTAFSPGHVIAHSSPLPLLGAAAAVGGDAAVAGQAAVQQQEPDGSEYYEESSSGSAVGRGGAVCYRGTKNRSMWCGQSTATASEEADDWAPAPAGSGVTAAGVAAAVAAAVGVRQHGPHAGDSSSGRDNRAQAAAAAAGASTAGAAAGTAAEAAQPAAGAQAAPAVSAGPPAPANDTSPTPTSKLARLSQSARNFLRPGSNPSGAAAAATSGAGAAGAGAGTGQLPLLLQDAAAGALHQGVVGLSDLLPQQQHVAQHGPNPANRPTGQHQEPQQDVQAYERVEPAAQATRQVHFDPAVAAPTVAAAAMEGAVVQGADAPLRTWPPEPSASGGSHSVTVYSSGSSSAPHSSSVTEQDSSSDDEQPEEQQQPKLTETEAAIAAVMSLKASLAKQAFAGGIARQRSATAAVAANRLSVDAGLAAAGAHSAAPPAAAVARHSFDVATARAYANPATGPDMLRAHSAYALAVPPPFLAPGVGAGFGHRGLLPQQQLWAGAAGPHPAAGREGMAQRGMSWSGPLSPAAGRGATQARPPPSPVPGVPRGVAGTSAPLQHVGPLPLHLVHQQLSALEVHFGTAAAAAGDSRSLGVQDGARQRGAADAQAAAAAHVPVQDGSSPAPAASRSWHTGLANLASHLLQPAFFGGPRSPQHQQHPHAQPQLQLAPQQQQQQRVPPRWSPRTSWKPPVRKTVSASQLGANRTTSFFANPTPAATPAAAGVLPGVAALLNNAPSQPLPPVLAEESTLTMETSAPSSAQAAGVISPDTAAAGVTAAARASAQHLMQLQQQRSSLQLPLLSSLQQGGAAGGPQQLGLAGLDPAQLQLLAQIADAARAQVSPLSVVGDPLGDQQKLGGDSLVTQQRWRSAPSAGTPSSDSLLQQQGPHTSRPRPQHTASFNQPGVRQYGTSAATVAAAQAAAAACSTPRGVATPAGSPGPGGQHQTSPGGRPRRSSAPVLSQQQQQLYKQQVAALQQQQQHMQQHMQQQQQQRG